jgi:hypothetical protein
MKKVITICTFAALLAACGQKQEAKNGAAKVTPATETTQQVTQTEATTQSVTASSAPSGMGGGATLAAASGKLSGTVAETLDSAGFTYVRLATDQGDQWAVVPSAKLQKGAHVSLTTNMVAEKFESKSLKKTFDKLAFATIDGAPPASVPAHGAGMVAPAGMISPHAGTTAGGGASTPPQGMMAMMKAQHSGAAAVDDNTPIKVSKAEGDNGKTVAEIWAARASTREGQPVIVRGKVVKFLPGIMGKNWIHLRDGSGSKEKGDNDITITTSDTVAVGSVVQASGVLHLNKDFGAGYSYPVIIEEAKVN